jgi:DNA-binding NarL/FixJ family response regulator
VGGRDGVRAQVQSFNSELRIRDQVGVLGEQPAPPVRVVVLDPLMCYRRGLSAALSAAGFEPFEPPDVEEWARSGALGAVVITLLDDVDAKRLRGLRAGAPTTPHVALLPEVTVDAYRWAMRCGATAAIGRDASPEDVIECLSAACTGRAIMPASLALALAMAADPGEHPSVSTAEVRWLIGLSEGRTVLDLAHEVGYSEREMFRRLHKLYAHMGVCGRTEALLAAQRWGLV